MLRFIFNFGARFRMRNLIPLEQYLIPLGVLESSGPETDLATPPNWTVSLAPYCVPKV
jgi:hypothetical protein